VRKRAKQVSHELKHVCGLDFENCNDCRGSGYIS